MALPMCLAEFSIQGPSDGHRRAQGLKFSEEKGIEYTDASEGGGQGDFTIQGATDGNSNFQIQGATDGHSNFQIQGPSDGGASTYNVQGPIDRYGQSTIQGAYDANQVNGKALQYDDPSGYRVNWRSYDRQTRPQAQEEPQQYTAQAAAPVSRAHRQRAHHARAQAQPQPQQQQPPEPSPNYRPYANAPPQIQQLLQFQQQIPYINIIPEPYRFDEEAAIRAQSEQVRDHLRKLAQEAAAAPITEYASAAPQPAPQHAPQPAPRQKSRGHSRSKRQAHQQSYQPPAEPQPQYSRNLPAHLRELLKFQAQTPYNIFANQVAYRGAEKPYVPQPVNQHQQQQLLQQQQQQQQPLQQAQYQGQGGAYDGQASAYTQALVQPAYNQNQQYQQLGYNQAGVRPVTENQN
ncbi:PREDICTED: alpha/beta-gliadin clone PW1215-like [Vollenhovia emeryi]|uniref:alpha/beta-gliadin clone PW1215-like n=1 Tax=Vollenhovia emeryi TaxID=411798 RepID=UPI0005F44B0B|nr:PREDICTED: alpha/beta-gliadin clone PW1215-like [Vollenhovia emeryi]